MLLIMNRLRIEIQVIFNKVNSRRSNVALQDFISIGHLTIF